MLRGETLDAIYSSPLRRAVETAGPVSERLGLRVRLEPDLQEISMGILEGRKRDESDPEALRLWEQWQQDKLGFRGHGGESYPDLERRVKECLQSITARHEGGSVSIVGHRGANRVILAHLMNWSTEQALGLRIHHRYLYEISGGRIASIRLDEGKAGRRYEGYRE